MVVQNQSQLGEGSAILTDPHHTPTFMQPSTQPQKTQQPRKPKRKDTQVPQPSDPIENVLDGAVHKELVTVWFESVYNHSNDLLLVRGNILQSDEDRLKLYELMALCTTLQNWVLDLDKTKTTQHNEIDSLKRMVKKLEKKDRSRTHRLKRLYKVGLTTRVESSNNEESFGEDASKQVRIDAIDVDEEITLVSVQNVDEEMFDVNVLDGEEGFVAEQEVDANEKDDDGEITLAQALIEMKSTKPKVKGVIIQESDESTTTTSTSTYLYNQSPDKVSTRIRSLSWRNYSTMRCGMLSCPTSTLSLYRFQACSLCKTTTINIGWIGGGCTIGEMDEPMVVPVFDEGVHAVDGGAPHCFGEETSKTASGIMLPKQNEQAAIAKLVSDEVAKALTADRATRNATGAGGPGNIWFEKMEKYFWDSANAAEKVEANRKSWDDMKKMMLEEFCPEEEISKDGEGLRNLTLGWRIGLLEQKVQGWKKRMLSKQEKIGSDILHKDCCGMDATGANTEPIRVCTSVGDSIPLATVNCVLREEETGWKDNANPWSYYAVKMLISPRSSDW
ncbi:hypothetical protein Tco_0097939 [Tanacetum coccineum]